MSHLRRFRFALLGFALVAGARGLAAAPVCTCCEVPAAAAAPAAPAPGATSPQPEGHPLRGVIVAVLEDRQALLVKHEEIPGVMRAMTMMLKVDASTLAAARKGQAITATLVRQADGWWLRDVVPVSPGP